MLWIDEPKNQSPEGYIELQNKCRDHGYQLELSRDIEQVDDTISRAEKVILVTNAKYEKEMRPYHERNPKVKGLIAAIQTGNYGLGKALEDVEEAMTEPSEKSRDKGMNV